MKFNNANDLVVTGEIENKQVTISEKDSDFIVAAISSMLYTNPIQSFSREIVSNAYDSHIEAKQKNPIVITLGENLEGNFFCTIRDFGTGISPENFDLYYRKVGSSTKRDTNEQIGMYGFGRFSALAVADFVIIKSFYEGTVTQYLMYKEGVKIFVNETSKTSTDEPNGLEVGVFMGNKYKNKEAFAAELLNPLYYFEDVYVENKFSNGGVIDAFNINKIVHYKNFSISKRPRVSEEKILLGKVLYNVDYEINKEIREICKKKGITNHFYDLRFEIGELEVTPNRENIIDNQSNRQKIRDKAKDALNEFLELVKDQMTTTETSLYYWYKKNQNYYSDFYLNEKDFDRMGSIQIETEKCHFSFHDKEVQSCPEITALLRKFYVDKKIFRVVGEKTYSNISYSDFIKAKYKIYPYNKAKSRTYVSNNNGAILKYSKKDLYKAFILEGKNWDAKKQKYVYNKAYKPIFKYFLKDLDSLPILPEKEIISYDSSTTPKKPRNKKEKIDKEQICFIPISAISETNYLERKTTPWKLSDFIATFKSKTVVYTHKFTKEAYNHFIQFKGHKNQVFIKLDKKDLPRLSKLRNLIPFEEFCSYKNKFVQKMVTIEHLQNINNQNYSVFDALNGSYMEYFLDMEKYKELYEKNLLYKRIKGNLDYCFKKAMSEAKSRRLFDYEFIAQFNEVNKVRLAIGKYLQTFYNNVGIYVLLFFLLKNKIVRPKYSKYLELKNKTK